MEQRKSRYDLDDVAPDNPGAYAGWCSQRSRFKSGAASANIDAKTPDPDGGVIERDAPGEPTGIVRERHGLILQLVPPATEAELRRSLAVNLNSLLAKGITSITDAQKTPRTIAAGSLYTLSAPYPCRAKLQFEWDDPAAVKALIQEVGDGDDWLAIGPIKIFVDGGFTGPAAYTLKPTETNQSTEAI